MVFWKSGQLHASVREVDEDGLDAENGQFLKLSLQEAIQAMKDVAEGGEHIPEVPKEPEESGQ
jgi:hypothetical protein